MASSLPRAAPEDQLVDPAAILRFLDAVEDHPGVEMHSLMVLRHGHVVAEGWWAPYSAERPQLLYSLSKSFTATAAAFAQAEGLLDLDDTVVSHFGEFAADITDPRSRSVKIRHVASMASGHTREMLDEVLARDPAEPVRGFLLIPPDREPGTAFAYSQPCTYTLASIIQRNAGLPLTRYLRPRLFDPLGIGHVGWQAFPPGREQGFSGLHARTEDIAKLGQLYLQRRPVGRSPADPRAVGRRGDLEAGRQPRRGESRLAAGLWLPVLDGPARVPRGRGIRAVLRDPARARHGRRHHRLHARDAGGARRHVGAPATRPRRHRAGYRVRARRAHGPARPPGAAPAPPPRPRWTGPPGPGRRSP